MCVASLCKGTQPCKNGCFHLQITRHLPQVGIHVGPSEPAETSAHGPQDRLASRKTNYLLKNTFYVFHHRGQEGGKSVYTQYFLKKYMGKLKKKKSPEGIKTSHNPTTQRLLLLIIYLILLEISPCYKLHFQRRKNK